MTDDKRDLIFSRKFVAGQVRHPYAKHRRCVQGDFYVFACTYFRGVRHAFLRRGVRWARECEKKEDEYVFFCKVQGSSLIPAVNSRGGASPRPEYVYNIEHNPTIWTSRLAGSGTRPAELKKKDALLSLPGDLLLLLRFVYNFIHNYGKIIVVAVAN